MLSAIGARPRWTVPDAPPLPALPTDRPLPTAVLTFGASLLAAAASFFRNLLAARVSAVLSACHHRHTPFPLLFFFCCFPFSRHFSAFPHFPAAAHLLQFWSGPCSSPTRFFVSVFFSFLLFPPPPYPRGCGRVGPPLLGGGGGGMGNLLSVLWSQISGVREVKVRA